MAMNVGGASGVQSTINMTPMIDILLVLLIIFMAISPVKPKGLEALAPQPPATNTPLEPNERTIVIQVNKDKSLQLNQEHVAEDRLEERLLDIFKTRGDRVVFIKADPDLDFQYVASAIDHAHGANIDKVGLMTPNVDAGK